MAIVKEDKQVFFGGQTVNLVTGVVFEDNSEMVKLFPALFEVAKEIKPKVQTKKIEKVEVQKVEELKEEILIEEPTQELKVEIKEESAPLEIKPKKSTRSKSTK